MGALRPSVESSLKFPDIDVEQLNLSITQKEQHYNNSRLVSTQMELESSKSHGKLIVDLHKTRAIYGKYHDATYASLMIANNIITELLAQINEIQLECEIGAFSLDFYSYIGICHKQDPIGTSELLRSYFEELVESFPSILGDKYEESRLVSKIKEFDLDTTLYQMSTKKDRYSNFFKTKLPALKSLHNTEILPKLLICQRELAEGGYKTPSIGYYGIKSEQSKLMLIGSVVIQLVSETIGNRVVLKQSNKESILRKTFLDHLSSKQSQLQQAAFYQLLDVLQLDNQVLVYDREEKYLIWKRYIGALYIESAMDTICWLEHLYDTLLFSYIKQKQGEMGNLIMNERKLDVLHSEIAYPDNKVLSDAISIEFHDIFNKELRLNTSKGRSMLKQWISKEEEISGEFETRTFNKFTNFATPFFDRRYGERVFPSNGTDNLNKNLSNLHVLSGLQSLEKVYHKSDIYEMHGKSRDMSFTWFMDMIRRRDNHNYIKIMKRLLFFYFGVVEPIRPAKYKT